MQRDPDLPVVSFVTAPRPRTTAATTTTTTKKKLTKTVKKRKRVPDAAGGVEKRFRIKEVEPAGDAVVEPSKGFGSAIATILSKATPEESPILPGVGEVDHHIDEKRRARRAELAAKKRSKLLSNKDRVIPTFENEDRAQELQLKRIATAGVVKLFNALKKQQQLQKTAAAKQDAKLRDPKPAEKLTKERFQELLKSEPEQNSKETEKEKEKEEKEMELEEEGTEKPKWGVLQDDFMLGASFKQWDKKADSDSNDSD